MQYSSNMLVSFVFCFAKIYIPPQYTTTTAENPTRWSIDLGHLCCADVLTLRYSSPFWCLTSDWRLLASWSPGATLPQVSRPQPRGSLELTMTASPTTCSANPQCPQDNGCVSTAENRATYQLSCNTDFNGRNINVVFVRISSAVSSSP